MCKKKKKYECHLTARRLQRGDADPLVTPAGQLEPVFVFARPACVFLGFPSALGSSHSPKTSVLGWNVILN